MDGWRFGAEKVSLVCMIGDQKGFAQTNRWPEGWIASNERHDECITSFIR